MSQPWETSCHKVGGCSSQLQGALKAPLELSDESGLNEPNGRKLSSTATVTCSRKANLFLAAPKKLPGPTIVLLAGTKFCRPPPPPPIFVLFLEGASHCLVGYGQWAPFWQDLGLDLIGGEVRWTAWGDLQLASGFTASWPAGGWVGWVGTRNTSPATIGQMAVGQNQWYHFGVGAPPILVYFSD